LLQQVARLLTDKPVRHLVNTIYHGDHTFGNAAFPASTEIVASRRTAQSMTDLDYEKRPRAENLFGNLDAIAGVTTWREPDRVFDDHLALDLGGREVELWHFGPGNSPGDTVVWVPEARAAWTGNLVSNQRALTMLLEIPPGPYIDTLARFKQTLDVATIVPGHGPLANPRTLDRLMAYLRWLLGEVRQAMDLGLSPLATVETVRLAREFRIPRWHPASRIAPLVNDFHRLNVLATYRFLERADRPVAASGSARRASVAGRERVSRLLRQPPASWSRSQRLASVKPLWVKVTRVPVRTGSSSKVTSVSRVAGSLPRHV
jgi:cyclase